MEMSNTSTFTFEPPVVIHNGDSVAIGTTTDVFVVNTTTTTIPSFIRMAHPMTADEIIDQAARELARKRPAD